MKVMQVLCVLFSVVRTLTTYSLLFLQVAHLAHHIVRLPLFGSLDFRGQGIERFSNRDERVGSRWQESCENQAI